MSPLYEYRCTRGHTHERLRSHGDRLTPSRCNCGLGAAHVLSVPAKRTDGIYSYAPNIGTEADYERRTANAKTRTLATERDK